MAQLHQEWGRILSYTNEGPDFSSIPSGSERWWAESLQAEKGIEPTSCLWATWAETKTLGGSYRDVMDFKLMEQTKAAEFSVYPKWTVDHPHSSDKLSVSSSWAYTACCHIHQLSAFASTPEAPSSPCKCSSHRVTDFKPVTKWLKVCHHNASYLGAQILCWILFMTCLSIESALLHFQQICVRTMYKRRQEVQSNPEEEWSKFSFTFLIRKFYYGCLFILRVFP